MPRNDYAILVGISHYPAEGFPPLEGPPRDVQRFYDWLIDPQGGDVDPDNITRLLSPDPPPQVTSDMAPPQFGDFQVAFQHLVTGGGRSIQNHSQNRLYLYFSGHGFCEIRNQMPQAALYAANASRLFNWNIAGTLYALWAKEVALFGEIVLVMDAAAMRGDQDADEPPIAGYRQPWQPPASRMTIPINQHNHHWGPDCLLDVVFMDFILAFPSKGCQYCLPRSFMKSTSKASLSDGPD